MTNEKVTFSIRLDGDVREALENEAEKQDRSMNWLINKILREALIGGKK